MRVPRLLEPAVRRSAGPLMYALARLSGGVPPGLRRGSGFGPADVPVVLVVVPGATEAHVTAVVEAVRAAQWATDLFTPVFLLDAPVLPVVRRAGYVAELAAGVRSLGAAAVEARTSYRADVVVLVPEGAVGTLGEVLVHFERPPAARTSAVRARLRALEARLR